MLNSCHLYLFRLQNCLFCFVKFSELSKKFEIFYCLLDFEFERESVSNYREISNYNRGDVASLAEDHCSLITRASQFSSTTRNLVPRFKRGVRGKALVKTFKRISSKKSIPFVDVFNSLFRCIMINLSSFLRELHRTYKMVRREISIWMDSNKIEQQTVNSGKKHKYLSN